MFDEIKRFGRENVDEATQSELNLAWHRSLAGVRAAEDPLLPPRSNRNIARMSDMDATTMWHAILVQPEASSQCVHLASAEAVNLSPTNA
jgi:hypothetical protein